MQIKRGHLYVVDFNPRVRTKPESFVLPWWCSPIW